MDTEKVLQKARLKNASGLDCTEEISQCLSAILESVSDAEIDPMDHVLAVELIANSLKRKYEGPALVRYEMFCEAMIHQLMRMQDLVRLRSSLQDILHNLLLLSEEHELLYEEIFGNEEPPEVGDWEIIHDQNYHSLPQQITYESLYFWCRDWILIYKEFCELIQNLDRGKLQNAYPVSSGLPFCLPHLCFMLFP